MNSVEFEKGYQEIRKAAKQDNPAGNVESIYTPLVTTPSNISNRFTFLEEPLSDKLKRAAIDGLVFGVKWGVVLVVLAMITLVFVGDYQTTRARAFNGQAAFEFIAKAQQDASRQATPQQAPVNPADLGQNKQTSPTNPATTSQSGAASNK